MSVYYMRNFMEIIDYCMEKMQVSMMDKGMCDKTIMREVFMHLKQMKMECEQFLTYRMDGMHMDKMMMRLMEFIKMFTMQMERLVMFEDCRMEYPMLLKDICMRYVMFLERLYTKVGKFEMEYSPVMNYRNMMYRDSGMKTMMPFYYWRQMKY
uniref:Uncharacterized protein n=1 Tax=Lygus hesperus TaxID=30085 RepID=A0A146MBV2_LYGHE